MVPIMVPLSQAPRVNKSLRKLLTCLSCVKGKKKSVGGLTSVMSSIIIESHGGLSGHNIQMVLSINMEG